MLLMFRWIDFALGGLETRHASSLPRAAPPLCNTLRARRGAGCWSAAMGVAAGDAPWKNTSQHRSHQKQRIQQA